MVGGVPLIVGAPRTEMVNVTGPLVKTVPPGSEDPAVTVTVTVLPRSWAFGVPPSAPVVGLMPIHELSQPGAPVQNAPMTTNAVGFGLPKTALVNGSASQSGSLPALPVCKVGGTAAALAFAGLISPGLYQLNLVIPPTAPNGDSAVSCTYNGSTTPAGALITVQSSTANPTPLTLLDAVTSSQKHGPEVHCCRIQLLAAVGIWAVIPKCLYHYFACAICSNCIETHPGLPGTDRNR